MNTDQLFAGQDSKGRFLPNYSETSVKVYGKPPGPIKLFDTGDFYRGFFIIADKFPILLDSKDSKSSMLQINFGNDIFGLNKENTKEIARVYILPEIQAYLRNVIKTF